MSQGAQREPSSQGIFASTLVSANGALFLTFPLDTIKTRIQTSRGSAFECAREVFRSDGLAGFYRGVAAALVSGAPSRAFNMSMCTLLIPKYASLLGYKLTSPTDKPVLPTFLAGASSGSLSCLATAPFEFTKTASQVETAIQKNPNATPGSLHAVRRIWRKGGVRLLYGGVEYHCLRDSLGSGIYFAVYESIKRAITNLVSNNNGPAPAYAVAIAGAACGATSWVVIYPIDTMKSEYQKALYSSALKKTVGPVPRPTLPLSLSMFRGLGFSLIRTSLNGILIFSIFESMIRIVPF